MRINKYVAMSSNLSRRAADAAIVAGRVMINDRPAAIGDSVSEQEVIRLDGQILTAPTSAITIMLHKPVGFVVSHNGQGSPTIYDLLPAEYQALQPIGRLDKNSSGLLLLTNDGHLAQALSHPSQRKRKVYEVTLDNALQPLHRQIIEDHGVALEDGASRLQLARQQDGNDFSWLVTMHEGRNRQIRRTFKALGYEVIRLHRIQLADYRLGNLTASSIHVIN